jgi:uncharacterized protein YndB with AHSA1/START domain
MMEGEKQFPHKGTYKVLTPYSRMVFTWETPWSAADTEVELVLTPAEGGTEIVLTHIRFISEESLESHRGGWTGILGKLEALFA